MSDPSSQQAAATGIDVSEDQGTVDWPSVAGAGYLFAFIKATDGQDYVDPMFAANWAGAQAAGLLRGAYHFFRAEDSPQVQAQWFWQTVGPGANLPLVVDVEESMDQSNEVVVSNLQLFLETLEQLSGQTPMIYTDPGFWNGLDSTAFGTFPLWVAEYGAAQPQLPAGWMLWDFWQYSETGTVPGIEGDVDLDVWNGPPSALRQAYPASPASS